VANKIDEAIREYYSPAEETAHFMAESDNPQYWPDGESTEDIIQEIAGVEPEIATAVGEYLSSAEEWKVRDGDDPYYDGTPLEHVPPYPDEFMGIWLQFEGRLKHEVRFFDEKGKHLLDELFADLPTLGAGKAIVTLEPGAEFSTLYRARIVDHLSDAEAFIRNPAQKIGPPPPPLARAGRMNPVGVPVFYGAFSEEVAVAEVRPPVGAVVAVGKFSLLRPVRLLDVSFLPFAYHGESIFSPSYDRLRNKVVFLEKFHHHISRPVLPSDEALEYLPTQAVAAYVANVMGLNGVIYGSTQIGAEPDRRRQVDRAQCNVALFGEAARVEGAEPQLEVVDDPTPFIPILGLAADELLTAVAPNLPEPEITAVPLASDPAPYLAPEKAVASVSELPPASASIAFTLRADPQPTLVKIRSIAVETTSIYSHLNQDGSVTIHDYENGDD
jgi:hypothetical protein